MANPLGFESGSQYPQMMQVNPTTALESINILNLNEEEQTKLRNITQLQLQIQQSQNPVNMVSLQQTKGESNLRREKELTEREKVELEMKKWKKKVRILLKCLFRF